MRINVITGTQRADELRGTDRRDLILALGGDDLAYGDGPVSQEQGTAELAGTSDLLVGGAAHDALFGDGIAEITGQDVYGGTTRLLGGDDALGGGSGSDLLYGDGLVRGASRGSASLTGGRDAVDGGWATTRSSGTGSWSPARCRASS